MSWESYKKKMEEVWKKQEEEKRKAKNTSSNKITKTTVSNNANNQQRINSLSDIVNKNNGLASFINKPSFLPKNETVEDVKEQLRNPKKNSSYNGHDPSLWDIIQNFVNGGSYVARKTGAGVASGTAGIAQAGITDTAKNIQQGQNMTDQQTVLNMIKAITGNNPIFMGIDIVNKIKNQNENPQPQKSFPENVTNALLDVGTGLKENTGSYSQLQTAEKLLGKVNPNASKDLMELNQKISNPINKMNEGLAEEEKNYDEMTKFLGNVGQSVGNMAPAIAVSTISKNPQLGLATMGLSAKGQATQEALNKGADLEQAVKIGDTKAMVEVGTEMLTGGVNIFGKGALDEIVKRGVLDKVKNNVAKAVAKQGLNIAGETLEETISDTLGTLIDKGTVDPNAKYSIEDWKDTALTTALTTTILNSFGIAGDVKDIKAKNENAQNWINKAQDIVNQNADNKVVEQETKTPQNQISQAENDAKTQTTNNLAKVRQFYDEDTYNQMKNFIETAPNEKALNQINEDIKTETKNKLEEIYKSEKFTESKERKQTYAKYQRQNNTTGIEYNNELVDNALDTVAPNRNGRRTVEQWKQVAEQIGLEASNLPKEEIDNIAYGSWFELQPTKNITRYDNRTKQNKSFEKFTSDDWINTIYESAKGQKIQQLDTELNQEQYSLAETQPQNNFKYEQSDNAKIDTFRQDASRYWDNSENTTKLVNTIEKIINDKGYNIKLDDTLGDNINGRIVTNQETGETEITINPNSNRKGEFIIGHELTHAIQTQEMVDLIDARMKQDGKLRNAVEDLKKLYGTDDINAEVLADISGQLFGNQEFINNLSVEKPSVFKRIYDTIVSLANKITGNSSEALFIKDLKNKWEKAYRENTNMIKEEQYSKNATKLPEVKEGYTRLYRGLESEYNPQYDKNKLDNVNGYESWTDDYDLAKSYGDNVYYIDIPTSEIKNSIIDEDSTSETYGDRNLIYKNNKPVGINGKNGNEYMLYTEHDNYKNIKYNKANNQATTQDNQGRQLSNQQQEFFKDSKVRDEKGNLLTVYHGTMGEFNIFDIKKAGINYENSWSALGRGFYFTPNYDSAKEYASSGTTGKNKNIKEVYINVINPFNISKDYTQELSSLKEKYNIEDFYLKKGYRLIKLLNEKNIDSTNILQELGFDGIIEEYSGDIDQVVAFYPNQIKNIDNKNPTSNPDIRYSKQNQSWQDYLEKNYKSEGTTTDLRDIRLPMKEKTEVKAPIKQTQENTQNTKVKFDNEVMKTNSEIKGNSDTNKKVAKILSEPEKQAKPEQRTWAILKANFIDKGAVFEKLSQKTKNRDLQGKYDYTLTAGARGQYAIGNDRYTYSNGKKTLQSKSLTSIIDEVGENTQAFNEYMYHQLNVDRMTLDERFGIDNKPVFGDSVTADMSRAEIAKIEEQHPEFKKYAKDVYNYLDANKQELVDRGVISQETSDFFKERYPHYVPIQRITSKGNSISVPLDTGRTGINTPIKKAKGGNQDINPLFQTMANQTLQTYRASARNNFGLELMNTLRQTNQLNENTTITDIDDIVDTMTNEEQSNELLQKGKKGQNPTFTVFDNGNKVTYEISQDMYDALKPKSELLNKLDNKGLSKFAKTISNIRRGVLTEYNPVFSITNALKDAQDVLVNSQHATKTYAKFPEAYAQIVKKGYWYNEYIQNGGEQNSYFTEGDFENLKKSKLDKTKNILTFPLQKISQVNNVIEMAPRLAEYIVSRQNGANIETAMLDAARVTTNFKAGGDITKFANRNGATFLNASVQGFQQQVRNIQEANMKGLKGWTTLATKYAVAGLPVLLLNNLFWKDDEDYEQLQDYVKDNYYVVAKLPNGNFLRIPKGRMVASIQKVISNVNDFVKDGKINSDDVAGTIWNDLKEDVSFGMDNLAPNNPIDNNILSPIMQVAQNKTWYGDDLVPSRLQNVPEAEQSDETTDKFSKWLGEKLNVSPIKINYLLDQYGGGVSDVLLPLGTPQVENNVVEDKFTTDPIMKSQYPSDFFSKRDELETASNSLKATDEDKLRYKYISGIQEDVSKLYKKKREIQSSNKSDNDKKKELKEVQKQINKLTKEGVENIDTLKTNGDTATIGGKEYYKIDGTWKVLNEDKKVKGVSLKTYANYQNLVQKEKQRQIKKGKLDDGDSLKTKDKISLLKKTGYSSSEKKAIYSQMINKKDSTYNGLSKLTNVNIDAYLDYKLQEIKGDDDPKSNIKGKSKTGSRKKNLISYLNNSNLSGLERLYIYGQSYKYKANQQAQMKQALNNSNLSNKDRLTVIKGLTANIEKHENGKYYWKKPTKR